MDWSDLTVVVLLALIAATLVSLFAGLIIFSGVASVPSTLIVMLGVFLVSGAVFVLMGLIGYALGWWGNSKSQTRRR
ncbi:hypothetical protein DVK02_08185 [Halobellus sp. Atlit-31R]|nr:hypothetical protein DVK02_08185 [Halobellus sp. Atlit-31R]